MVDEFKRSGKYNIKFSGINLSSGVYFYKIKAGNFSDTKKLILMK
ncbi:MAG: T9SS type A sorting domain-containing protein [Melioribacteraceae bacterium]